MGSDFIELGLSTKDNLLELEYRENLQPKELKYNNIEKQILHDAQFPDDKHIEYLRSKGIEIRGTVLDLGAGSTWFSCKLAKLNRVDCVFALDFSRHLLTVVAPEVIKRFDIPPSKLIRVQGSFYDLSYFANKGTSFDFITFHCTLHHAENIVDVLNEVKKVLKPGGSLVCIGEPFAANGALGKVSKFLFGRNERKLSVTENCFTLQAWKNLFHRASLEVQAFPIDFDFYGRRAIDPRRIIGTLLFPKYILLATVKGL